MNKFLLVGAAAVVGAGLGYIAGKGLVKNLPDEFSINIPYGPKLSFKRKAGK